MPVLRSSNAPHHDIGTARFTSLATPSRGSTDTAVWRVEIDPDGLAVPHALTRQEVFVVTRGRAAVTIADTHEVADVGDAIVVPADTPFALANGGEETLELLCCFPVGGQALVDGTAITPPWAQ